MRNAFEACWNQIGVRGDASCTRLVEVGHCRNCDEYGRAGRSLFEREASEPLREEWSRLLAEVKPPAETHAESLVVFQVCGEYVALRSVLLERVVGMQTVHTIPSRSGKVLVGLVNVDGELLPCFSAAAALQLGTDNPPSNPRQIMVLHLGHTRLACAVDQVVGFVRVPAEDLETPPVTLSRDERLFTTAVFSMRGKSAGLLDGDRLFERFMKSANV